MTNEYDQYRPPEPPRRRRRGGWRGRRGAGGAEGAREQPMVPEAEFTSYYDRPIVKPPPPSLTPWACQLRWLPTGVKRTRLYCFERYARRR